MTTHTQSTTGIPITDSNFWQDRNECTDDVLKHVFRSSTLASIPLLGDRIFCLRQAGKVLYEVSSPSDSFGHSLKL